MAAMLRYFVNLKPGKTVLWCYLIWYLATVYFHFEATPRLWLNSLGISAVIGTGLLLSVNRATSDRWQTFRLYLMPFGVSSFSALIKGKGFILIFSPILFESLITATVCVGFVLCVLLIKCISIKRMGSKINSDAVIHS